MHFGSSAVERRDGTTPQPEGRPRPKKSHNGRGRVSPDRAKASAAIRKGTIKISGPTLVTKPNEEDFPFRASARVFSAYEESHMLKTAFEQATDEAGKDNIGRAVTTSEVQPQPRLPATGSPRDRSARTTIFTEEGLALDHVDRSEVRNTLQSVDNATSTGSYKAKRKNKGIRKVFQRMFRRSTVREPADPKTPSAKPVARGGQAPEHHRSDPGMLSKQLDEHISNLALPRVSSAPFGEITKATALGSYSSGAADTHFSRDMQSSRRESASQGPRSRRASLPSVTWTGLAPRPADHSPRGSAYGGSDAERNHSEASRSAGKFRRRSRSAGDLQQSEGGSRWQPGVDHQLSSKLDELRRSMSEPRSPLSPRVPVDRGARPLETVQLSPKRDPLKSNPLPPLFSPFIKKSGASKRMARASLEDRVDRLEVKSVDLHAALEELQNAPRVTCAQSTEFFLDEAPKNRSFRGRDPAIISCVKLPPTAPPVSHGATASVSTTQSFERTEPYNQIPITPREEAPPPADPAVAPALPQATNDTSSTNRVSNQLDTEQYNLLVHLLQHERAARKRLERQVYALQREIHTLRTPILPHAGARHHGIAYPTPSPELSERISRARDSGITCSPEFGRSAGGGESASDATTDDEEEGFEAASEEVYETPTEVVVRQSFPGLEGEEDVDEDEDTGLWGCAGKDAAVEEQKRVRGLSLGQLTNRSGF